MLPITLQDKRHRERRQSAAIAVASLFIVGIASAQSSSQFAHPGILNTQAQLNTIRAEVSTGEQPWLSGFQIFENDPYSKSTYVQHTPLATVSRDTNDDTGDMALWTDSNAAYQNALMYAFTGNTAYAIKSQQILSSWSTTLTTITGHDAILAAGLYGFKMVNAAEILRYDYSGWTATNTTTTTSMFDNVFFPVIENFATFANGNWDGACIKAMMAIGIYTNNHTMFNNAVNYWLNGSGNGSITHYVINATGQVQESGRDQAHTQLGLGLLAESAQVAENQGVDLWSADNNRLMAGFEYTAEYNLGNNVPFTPFTDQTGQVWTSISPTDRGVFRAVWQMAYNHYHNEEGLSMPWTQQVLDQTDADVDWSSTPVPYSPEGAPFQADNPGFGTLLFDDVPEPAALVWAGMLMPLLACFRWPNRVS